MLYLKRNEIDINKWDECVRQSPDGNPYFLSWYLDIVNPNWEALIEKDYSVIMPLPAKSKMGINYLIQPVLTKELGVIGKNIVSQEKVNLFFKEVSSKFRYINFYVNKNNHLPPELLNNENGVTYTLVLNDKVSQLEKRFSENHRRNLKKIATYNLKWEFSKDCSSFVDFVFRNSKIYRNLSFFDVLVEEIIKRDTGYIQFARNNEETIISAVLWLHFKNKHIYLISASNKEGFENKASFFLIYEYMKHFENTGDIIDFEGSKIKGLARFYSGFGSVCESFPLFKSNRLIWPIRLIKS